MSRRPARVPRWAHQAAGGAVVQPSPTVEAAGWATGTRPPAQYFNYLFNATGAWIDFLRGPSLSRWAWVELDADAAAGLELGVDRESTGTLRLVVAGKDADAYCVYVSHTGHQWTRRTNLPSLGTAQIQRVHHAVGLWFLVFDDKLLWSPNDGETGTALDGGDTWEEQDLTSATELRALATYQLNVGGAGNTYQVLVTATEARTRTVTLPGAVTSTAFGAGDTVTGAAPDGTTPRGAYTDVVWDGTVFLCVSTYGDVISRALADTNVGTTVSRIAVTTNVDWRFTVGAPGEVIAWRRNVNIATLWRTTDHGVTWTELTTSVGYFRSLAYHEGGWVASVSNGATARIVSSSDLVSWTPSPSPAYRSSGAGTVTSLVLLGGSWVGLLEGYASLLGPAVLVGDSAEDVALGDWSPDTTPTQLTNAGWLNGYRIAATAPTDGQVLAYNATSGRYEPTTVSGGGGGGTYGAGTLAARPASPAAGDTYAVTSLASKGDRFVAFVANAWTRVACDRSGTGAIATGPTLLWRLSETSGTFASEGSGTSTPLTFSGTALRGVCAQGGPPGVLALVAAKATSGIVTPPSNSRRATLLAWVTPKDTSGGNQQLIGFNTTAFSEPYGAFVLQITSNSIRAYVSTGGNHSPHTGATIRAGERQLIVATWDGDDPTYKLRGYIDGVEVISANPTGTDLAWGSATTWNALGPAAGSEDLTGILDSAAFYDDKALTQAEIIAILNAGRGAL